MAALSRSVIPWGYRRAHHGQGGADTEPLGRTLCAGDAVHRRRAGHRDDIGSLLTACRKRSPGGSLAEVGDIGWMKRSEEHTSELQSLMRISYAVFCLKTKKQITSK